jgi:2-keto-4-pentenoate hydratase/2-oxohepta-3-ene-1,7-dioic acid hydratase in catechol pathway
MVSKLIEGVPMKAFAYFTPKGGPRIGVETPDGKYNFTQIWRYFKEFKNFKQAPELPFLQLMVELDYFSNETLIEVMDTVKEFRSIADLRLDDDCTIQTPISRPSKIICLGRNYLAHAKEWKSEVPDQPMFFAKVPSSLLPHHGVIEIPAGIGRVDHELELAVVMGRKAAKVAEDKAMEYVAGYTIANDVTARDMQREDIKSGKPWTLAKGMDTFCPMGPYLLPVDAIADPHNLEMELKVNSVTKQKANTADMVFKIPYLISYISRFITLEPGDIICTGTPEGTLPIVPGDVIEASIQELGTLVNTVKEI